MMELQCELLDEEAEDIVPLPVGSGVLTMRPYQVEAVDAFYEAVREYQAILIVLATGLGKTVIAADIIARWPGDGRWLFVGHTRELIFQSQATIGKHIAETPAIEMGVYREGTQGHGILDRPKVLCASIQTLTTRMEKLKPTDFDGVILDECHHSQAVTWRRMWDYFKNGNPAIKCVGLTATPNRADNQSLRGIFEFCAFEMDIRDGIDSGWLVPIQQKYVTVEGLDFSKCRTVAKDLADSDLEEAMAGPRLNDSMSDEERLEALKKQEEMLHKIAAPAIKEAQGRPGIVFCVTVDHARRMCEIMRRYPGVTAECIVGETPDDMRAEMIRSFKKGDTQWLVGVGAITEGFDAPNCQLIVMARPTKSQSLYVQILGRGLRPSPGLVDRYDASETRKEAIGNSVKPNCVVLDFVGNSGKHKLISTADVLAGDMPEDLVAVAKAQMVASGESGDVRERAWAEKRRRDKLEEDRKKRAEEARLRQQAMEEARRSQIHAEAQYRSREINPFDTSDLASARTAPKFRGGSTDAQIAFLKRLGVGEEAAMKFTKSQAGAVISDLAGRRGGEWIMRFGKHQGDKLADIQRSDPDYFSYMARTIQDSEFQTNVGVFRDQWRRGEWAENVAPQ
ncbi:MAG: DEAD/DEAH box helicase family protein [Patescibacteria group bacterium]|nr:DEAD/DEAH box helicase family protein [Patescibacteria group bacterium]